MNEWPLLIFTISVQTAIGGLFMLWIFQLRNKDKNQQEIFELLKIPLIVIAGLSLIGLGGSFAHLGSPMNALNTIRNIGSSWMSREIVVTGAFIGLAVLTTMWALYRKKVSSWLLLGASIVGFIDVYCMAAIYTESLIDPWHSANTFLSFYGTTFILGSVVAVALLIPHLYKKGMEIEAKQFMKIALAFSVLGIGLQLIGTALLSSTVTDISIIGGIGAADVLSSYQVMIVSRWIISIIGLALFGYLAATSYKKSFGALTLLTLVVFVMSEGMGRYVFYILGS